MNISLAKLHYGVRGRGLALGVGCLTLLLDSGQNNHEHCNRTSKNRR
jgi:hypothetical protein